MTTIGIIYKKEDKLIAGTAQQVTKELIKQGYKVNLDKAEFVITLGGDGTILRAARSLAKKEIPILAVHLGGIGFLSEIELSEVSTALEAIQKNKYLIDERTMIEAVVRGKKILALNDIVISKSGIARLIKMEVEGIANYVGDGLIFSTATGSTAYNLAAGGPILEPSSQAIIISAICPHSLSSRPIVLEEPLTVKLTKSQEVILTADGQETLKIKEGERIQIGKSKLKTRFIRLTKYDFFERIKHTFMT